MCPRTQRPLNGIVFSPDGRRIYGATFPTLRAWDVQTGEELPDAWKRCLGGHENMLTDLAVSPDGRLVAAAAYTDRRVRLWDAATLEELSALEGHDLEATCVAFAPDGRRIVSGARDNTLRVWDATSRESLKILSGDGALATLAPPPPCGPFRASVQGTETIIEDARAGRLAAWFSVPLRGLVGPLGHPAWAGVRGEHLSIIVLEGAEAEEHAGGIAPPPEHEPDANPTRVLPFAVRAFLERDFRTCVVQAYARKRQNQCSLAELQLMLIVYQRAGQREDVEQIAREALEATANQPWDNLLIRVTLGDPGKNPFKDALPGAKRPSLWPKTTTSDAKPGITAAPGF